LLLHFALFFDKRFVLFEKLIEQQETTIQRLKSAATEQQARATKQEVAMARQQQQIEALTAGLQKVSAQLELSKPAPQTVCLPAIVLREGGNDR
jgi:hypothetical protein